MRNLNGLKKICTACGMRRVDLANKMWRREPQFRFDSPPKKCEKVWEDHGFDMPLGGYGKPPKCLINIDIKDNHNDPYRWYDAWGNRARRAWVEQYKS